jgi:hypothetical protein
MEGIKKAVLSSPEFKTAQSYKGKKAVFGKRNGKNYMQYDVDAEYVDYILSDRELFARAYAQYVVSRAGDERLSAELASQILFRNTTDIGGRTADSLHYFEYWNSENFKSIAAEFDKLFLSKGWIARP